ncbi:DUF1513 domain-containing protein [Chitinimonas sp. PSY-7]|uniref:DUF1513 domain-containing protein n=1 Tax=Chitinimonas sp. PSY-7 TaxID=3459088 RepID=UPI00403FD92D
MPLSRRHFLSASLTIAAWPLHAARPSKQAPIILSASWDNEEDWCAGTLMRPSATLPARGHVLIPNPNRNGEAIVVARRPGYYLARIDWRRGRLLQHFELEDERNLVGHAVFSHDGKQLITAETDERNGVGRLVVRDARSFKRLEDRPSHGVGPHEILWLDRHTLAVANGGILTLPETGRYKRNIDRMDPSLVLIDSRDGGLLKEYRLPDNKLSIRHLAVTTDGTLGAALQNEGSNSSPMLAILRDGQFGYADTPPELCQTMQGYAASLAALGNRFLMPCPTGNLLTEWNSAGQPTAQLPLPRVFGAASLDGNWLASGEGGEIWQLQPGSLKLQMEKRYPHHWDNHLTVIAGAQ